MQETVLSVAKKMPKFQYNPARGSFKGWLLQLTRWRIADQLRSRQKMMQPAAAEREPADAVSEEEGSAYEPFSLELWDEEWKNNLLQAALDRIKRRVNPKTYQIFELYVIQEWPVTKIRSLLGVSMGRIYLIKHRVSHMIKREMQLLEKTTPKFLE